MRINAFLGHEEVRRLGCTFNETLIHLHIRCSGTSYGVQCIQTTPGVAQEEGFQGTHDYSGTRVRQFVSLLS